MKTKSRNIPSAVEINGHRHVAKVWKAYSTGIKTTVSPDHHALIEVYGKRHDHRGWAYLGLISIPGPFTSSDAARAAVDEKMREIREGKAGSVVRIDWGKRGGR